MSFTRLGRLRVQTSLYCTRHATTVFLRTPSNKTLQPSLGAQTTSAYLRLRYKSPNDKSNLAYPSIFPTVLGLHYIVYLLFIFSVYSNQSQVMVLKYIETEY